MTSTLTDNLVHFVRYLRAAGIRVVPQTTADLVRATELVGLESRDDVHDAFLALTTTRGADRAVFDEAFELFFGSGKVVEPRGLGDLPPKIPDNARANVIIPVLRSKAQSGPPDNGFEDLDEQLGASSVERIGTKDFDELTRDEQAEVKRLIAAMMWRPSEAKGRRLGPARRGPKPDMRRTLRRMMSGEGDLMRLAFSDRRERRRPLVVLADVSGSMDRYTEMFLYFIHAAQGRLGRVEAFVFSTHLTRITRQLRHPDPRMALDRVATHVSDWSGGTRIGDALRTFNWEWSRRVTRGGAVALVISDGWDCGDPELLATEMGRFARSLHRVVWLNPLAGRPGFAPETRGLRAILPHVDDFLPVANLADLRDLVRLLELVPAQRGRVLQHG